MEKSRKEQVTAVGEGGGHIFYNIRLIWDCIYSKIKTKYQTFSFRYLESWSYSVHARLWASTFF